MVTVFADTLFVLTDASRHDEARHTGMGFAATGRLLFVVHIEVAHAYVRMSSACRAETEEERRYAD